MEGWEKGKAAAGSEAGTKSKESWEAATGSQKGWKSAAGWEEG